MSEAPFPFVEEALDRASSGGNAGQSYMPRRRTRAYVAAVLAVGLALLIGVAALPGDPRAHDDGQGALSGGESHTITGFPVTVGVPFSVGVLVENRSDQTVVLERVRFDPPLSGMSVVDIRVVDPKRPWSHIGGSRIFPPPEIAGRLVPLAGTVVEPGAESTQILLGLRLDRPADAWYRYVLVDYRVGDSSRTLRTDWSFNTCPDGPGVDGCDFPPELDPYREP